MPTYRSAEARLRAACILRARQGGLSADWVREQAHALFGVPAVSDLCLSLLDRDQLVRLRRRIGQVLGEAPPARQPADPARPPRGVRSSGRPARPGVVRLASVAQLQMVEGLRQELRLGLDELAGITWRATGQRTRQVRTTGDAHVTIEALLAVRARRAADRGPRTSDLGPRTSPPGGDAA